MTRLSARSSGESGDSGGSGVLSELAKACDEHARPAEDGDHVGGVAARFVASPSSTSETAEVLRVAAQHDLATVVRGAGTALHWGAAPSRLDLILDTVRLAGVVEHAAGDLVVVTRAGTGVDDLQRDLARADQELAFDNPLPGATVGGSIAVSPSGPRRLLRGTLRDLLIGVTFVRSDGVVAKSGGKVVKNVAGYDFGKLLTGSFGTLGVVTEAIFRLHPRPMRSHVVSRTVPAGRGVSQAVHGVLSSQTVPSAVEVDWPAAGSPTVAVLLEGTTEGVAERARHVEDLLDADAGDGTPPPWWGSYPFGPGDIGLKLTAAVSGVDDVVTSARAAADRQGLAIALRGSAAGVVHAGLPGDSDPGAVDALVMALRAAAPSYDGSVVVLTAPAVTRDALDLWGPVPGLDLMRRLKDELDPQHRLSPGRFVGGI